MDTRFIMIVPRVALRKPCPALVGPKPLALHAGVDRVSAEVQVPDQPAQLGREAGEERRGLVFGAERRDRFRRAEGHQLAGRGDEPVEARGHDSGGYRLDVEG